MQSITWSVTVSAILAVAYGLVSPSWYDAGVSHVALAALKCSSILVLALIAWTAGALAGQRRRMPAGTPAVHNKLLTAGLLFGAAGDALLAIGRDTFLYGAVAFLIGHLFYIALFTRAGMGVAALRAAWRIAAMVAVVLAAVVMASLFGAPRESALFVPLSVYTGVLTLMTLSSFTLPASRWLTMLGAVMFFISDGFVAAHMFHPIADPTAAFWSGFAGWMIYWAGQAGICVGALGLHKAPA